MLPSVMKRFLQSAVNRMHLPSTSMFGRCSSTAASHLEENISKSFVTGPLTMLSEEEEMMKETGTIFYSSYAKTPVDYKFEKKKNLR